MRGRAALFVMAAVVALLPWPAAHATPSREGTVEQGTQPGVDPSGPRTYFVYRPKNLAPANERALVVFLHGCAQTAADAMDGVPWNRLADERGFVVVYAEQSRDVDGNTGGCWNSGQAPAFDRGVGELEVLAGLTRTVRDRFKVPPGRVFIAGISSGALMTAAMAATYPDLYAAMGSVVGCGYPCGDATGVAAWNRMGEDVRVVPGFFVAGSLDYLINPAQSQTAVIGWAAANDLADDGERNESVATVLGPDDVERRGFDQGVSPAAELCDTTWNNPCPAGFTGWTDYPTTVARHRNTDGDVVVESWLLHGLSHNYPGGHPTEGTFTDPHGPDVTTAMFEFFLANTR